MVLGCLNYQAPYHVLIVSEEGREVCEDGVGVRPFLLLTIEGLSERACETSDNSNSRHG
jgi:hypothetical protein